ncbi:hypothetical protein [Chondromyces apiculatus]|uniref:Uncharacterized protein n=1 Tax=Chondromyces apiculatus DSM 436 TaxID=1192034 RepID=A0A017T8V0_9BACT|nr:hypothetical protein [Chondromyces apiculatus]EYF05683.1 Hypothetical protein CAP_2973 [Chondromyces apiculatus DSM 436]
MPPSVLTGARVLAVGALSGGVSVAALVVTGSFAAALDLPFPALFAAALLAATPLLASVARWAGVDRPYTAAAFAPLALFPMLLLYASYGLSQPHIVSHWRCGTGDVGLLMLAPFAFGMLGSLGGLLGVALAGRERRTMDTVLRAFALASTALAVALWAMSAVKAARYPVIADYVEALPGAVTVPPVAGEPLERRPRTEMPGGLALPSGEEGAKKPLVEERFVDPVPGHPVTLVRACVDEHCTFTLLPTAGGGTPSEALPDHLAGGTSKRAQPIVVRHDPAHRLWILGGVHDVQAVAFEESGGKLSLADVGPRDVGDALSPPLDWLVAGALGLLFAVLAQAWRWREAARLTHVGRALEGTLGEQGWVSFAGAMPARRVAPELSLPPGPVLVLDAPSSSDAHADAPAQGAAGSGVYRDGLLLGADTVVAGERTAVMAPLRAQCVMLDGLTLSAVLLTAAPLLCTWLFA